MRESASEIVAGLSQKRHGLSAHRLTARTTGRPRPTGCRHNNNNNAICAQERRGVWYAAVARNSRGRIVVTTVLLSTICMRWFSVGGLGRIIRASALAKGVAVFVRRPGCRAECSTPDCSLASNKAIADCQECACCLLCRTR